ncbi:MAG: hypothetical protein AAGI66_00855 [Cyanobacteria bacterium P01_H01_bin.74]
MSFNHPTWGRKPLDAPVQLSQPPAIVPDKTLSGQTVPTLEKISPFSPANYTDPSALMDFKPYNTGPNNINLWNIEAKKVVYSVPVVSPDQSAIVFSEVGFIPSFRQTYCTLFWVKLLPALVKLPPDAMDPEAQEPSKALKTYEKRAIQNYQNQFNPALMTAFRKVLARTKNEKTNTGTDPRRYSFKTLTVVDWSANSERILIKEYSGLLYLGLKTSNVLIFDEASGIVSIYPEIHRAIANYWQTRDNPPLLSQYSFDIEPLGWQPDSNNTVLLNAWHYKKTASQRVQKNFMGLWQYNIEAERLKLLSLKQVSATVATNGFIATPKPFPESSPQSSPSVWTRLKSWFKFQKS